MAERISASRAELERQLRSQIEMELRKEMEDTKKREEESRKRCEALEKELKEKIKETEEAQRKYVSLVDYRKFPNLFVKYFPKCLMNFYAENLWAIWHTACRHCLLEEQRRLYST